MWTSFNSRRCDGRHKYIYIEAPLNEAIDIFYFIFNIWPNNEEFNIFERESLQQASGYQRGCDYIIDKSSDILTTLKLWRF